MKLSDWMRTPVKVEEDAYDRDAARQNPGDEQGFVWPSAPVEPDVQQVDVMNPDPEGRTEVRLLDGVLDFVDDIVEDFFDTRTTETPLDRAQKSTHAAKVLDVAERAATSWRAGQFNVSAQGGTKIVSERDDRRRVVVTNWGPGICYLSHEKGALITGTNVVQIPVNGSRTFNHADEIWAYPAVVGTTQSVDVQDEYGTPEWVSGGRR